MYEMVFFLSNINSELMKSKYLLSLMLVIFLSGCVETFTQPSTQPENDNTPDEKSSLHERLCLTDDDCVSVKTTCNGDCSLRLLPPISCINRDALENKEVVDLQDGYCVCNKGYCELRGIDF
jgi:hypothetical protein